MIYRSVFPREWFADMDRLQRAMQQSFESSPSIRGRVRGYPAVNVGHTATSVEIYVFAPGIDPAAIEVEFEKGTLTIAGERKAPALADKAMRHIDERFAGRFRRVITLPDDVDAGNIQARYRDGVLHIRVARLAEVQPRRIAIQ